MDKLVRKIEVPLAKRAVSDAGLYIAEGKDMERLTRSPWRPVGSIPCITGLPMAVMIVRRQSGSWRYLCWTSATGKTSSAIWKRTSKASVWSLYRSKGISLLRFEPIRLGSVGALFSSLENRGHVQATKAVFGSKILYDSFCKSH